MFDEVLSQGVLSQEERWQSEYGFADADWGPSVGQLRKLPDVLRALAREPATLEAFMAEVALAGGMDPRLDSAVVEARRVLEDVSAEPEAARYAGRRIVERLALLLQASLVLRHSPPAVAEAFLATRLGPDGGRAFGTLPPGVDCEAIVERHRPKLPARSLEASRG